MKEHADRTIKLTPGNRYILANQSPVGENAGISAGTKHIGNVSRRPDGAEKFPTTDTVEAGRKEDKNSK